MTIAAPRAAVEGRWDVAIVRGARDAALAAQGEVDWTRLVANLTDPVEWGGDKLDLPGWIPARFLPGETRRKAAAVESVSALVLDLDAGDVGPEGEAASLAAGSCGFSALFHTSWSHTPEKPKGRLVLPLDAPCPVGRWKEVWTAAAAWAKHEGLTVDPAAKDPCRLYFLPAVRPGGVGAFRSWAVEGQRLASWRWLVARYSPPPERREFKPVQPTATRGLDGHDRAARRKRFAWGVVRVRCTELASMAEGGRNSALFRAAAAVAQLAAAGVLDLRPAVDEVWRAAVASGLDESEINKTIHSGLSRGEADGPWNFKD